MVDFGALAAPDYHSPAPTWGKIVDKVTASMLKAFSEENGLTDKNEGLQFEHFASYATVQRHYGETFDTDDIVLGADQPGIDAIAIIVNGVLISDIDGFRAIAELATSLEVTFIFVQADTGSSFESGKMSNIVFAVRDFFREVPQLPRSPKLIDFAAIQAEIYAQSAKFKKANPACFVFYVTTGQWRGDKALEARRQSGIAELEAEHIFSSVAFDPIGADVLQKLYRQAKNAVAREFTFDHHVPAPAIHGVKEAYLGFIPAREFLSIITSEDGEIMHGIFESNIRAFQGYNVVNVAIKNTLDSDYKGRFVLMNNGVTLIARVLRRVQNKFHIEDFQIVNGCQTSNVLFENQDDIADVIVPFRLISSDDDDVIRSIVTATNQQTQLTREQLFAATEFPKALEHFFLAYEVPRRLFYERRSRQYDRQAIDKTKLITQANMIRAFAGMFLEEPHRTTRNFNALLDKVGKEIFVEGQKLDPYYVAAYTLCRLERLFKSQVVDAEFKAARFQILLAVRRLANNAPLPRFNSRDMEKYCATIIAILWDNQQVDSLITRACRIVEQVTQGNMHRDNIRTVNVTDAIKNHPLD